MLDISALKGMTQEEQLKKAAEYANVPVGVLAGIWKQESNHGQHPTMIGPATKWGTAKGHFQILDNVHATLEKRLGQKLDRFDFTEALVGAAELLRESKAHFGNDADAISAYHAGWNKKNWGAKTQDYVQKVMGYAGLGQAGDKPAQPTKRNPGGITADQWMAGTYDVSPADAGVSQLDAVRRAAASINTMPQAPANTVAPGEAEQRASNEAKATAEQTAKNEQGYFDGTVRHAYRETMRPLFNAIASMNQETGPDAAYLRSMAADPSQVMSLLDNPQPDEIADLLGTTSAEDRALALHNIQERRQNSVVLGRAGTAGQLSAMFIGGALDPTTYVMGFGAMKTFAAAGRGASVLAKAGRSGAALASTVGENVVGNVAYEAFQQALGEHKSVADYGMAAATSLLPAAIAAPGIWRQGLEAVAHKQINASVDAQTGYLARASEALGPDAEPDAIRALASEYEAAAIREDVQGRTATPRSENTLNAPDLDDPEFLKTLEAAPEGKPASMDFPEIVPPKQDTDAFDALALRPEHHARMDAQLEALVEEYGLTRSADELRSLKAGVHLGKDVADDAMFKRIVPMLEKLQQKYAPDLALHVQRNKTAGANQAMSLGPGRHALMLDVDPAGRGQFAPTAVHEMGHAIFEQYILSMPEELRARMREDWQQWKAEFEAGGGQRNAQERLGITRGGLRAALGAAVRGDIPSLYESLRGVKARNGKPYADYFSNLDEFSAEQFLKQVEKDLTRAANTPDNMALKALYDVVNMVKDLWEAAKQLGTIGPKDSYAEFFERIAKGQARAGADMAPARSMETPMQAQPPAAYLSDVIRRYGLDTMDTTDVRGRATQKALAQIIYDSESWLIKNPQDLEKMKTIMKNSLFDMRTPGLILASSQNPVFKAVAGILVENTMGGSGRQVTAALRKAQWEREFIGNSIVAYGAHYESFRNSRLGRVKGMLDDLSEANTRKEFNDLVYREVNARDLGQQIESPPQVKAAADALEVSYERMLKAQKDVRTVGWGALPEKARGYMPRVTDKRKWLTLSTTRKQALHAVLAQQARDLGDMDEAFANKVASKYLDHISTNANGGHEIPVNIHDPMALDYVQEAMRAAGMTKAEIDTFASKLARGGPTHTKARMNMDVLKEYTDADGSTFRLMDIMETDPIELLRAQARRVSGEVALTQHGVMGSAGAKLLRQAAEKAGKAGDPDHVAAMEAFDQVMAEMLGRPFGDQMPTWMEGAITANAASNLGMMGWMQMGELLNTATGLGVLDTMKMVADFPRIMQEVKVLAKGGKVENSILGSLEVSGAEFGMAGYKMVTQYDNPMSQYAAVGRQDSGMLIKALRVAGHKLGIVSLYRIIQATQVRGVAEQITKKALRYINEGIESKALADMGFTPEMRERIKAELPNIAKFENGVLASLDMTKAKDAGLAGEFIATINRGAGQLIQDTFIGEKGKWQHSNLGKMMTQFRSFPITAMEKQWGRMRGLHGVPGALGIVIAAAPMAFALYAARTALAAIGRPDADEYIEQQFQPIAVGRGLMNYIGALGLAPDLMDALTAIAIPKDVQKEYGLTNRTGGASTVGSVVPIVGYGDTLLKGIGEVPKIVWGSDNVNPHALARALPFSNAPGFTQALNLLRPDND